LLNLVIAVCTYQRVEELSRCLRALAKEIELVEARCRILVVDNDAEGSAAAGISGGWRTVDYVVEPARGIGNARNRALDEVHVAETLVFFDDDQVPLPGWLEALIKAHTAKPDAIISGLVLPRFESTPPRWGQSGWAWGADRAVAQEGELLDTTGFGNVLIPYSLISLEEFRVRDPFLHRAGEDTYLCAVAKKCSFEILRARSAIAIEPVLHDRLRIGWVVERFRQAGETNRMIMEIMGARPRHKLTVAVSRSLLGAFGVVFSMTDVRSWRARFVCKMAYTSGLMSRRSVALASRVN
jgi:hypothetical protein